MTLSYIMRENMSNTSADKRTVATDALESLGTILEGTEGRDAIHLAVEPVIAAEKMFPGHHVRLMADGRAGGGLPKDCVGIVDPFLPRPVERGERFWLVVYPRQITSLRHVWTHPAFPEAVPSASATASPATRDVGQQIEENNRALAELVARCAADPDSRAASEAWLREFIARSDCPDYETVMAAAVKPGSHMIEETYEYGGEKRSWLVGHTLDDDFFYFQGRDAHSEIPAEFWYHVAIVTGEEIEHRPRTFACSC